MKRRLLLIPAAEQDISEATYTLSDIPSIAKNH